MEDSEKTRIASLSSTGSYPELQTLWSEHLQYEKQLEEFDCQSYLTPDEQADRKRIQKLKLAGKDEIARILSQVAE